MKAPARPTARIATDTWFGKSGVFTRRRDIDSERYRFR
jgi:hypothetical protein